MFSQFSLYQIWVPRILNHGVGPFILQQVKSPLYEETSYLYNYISLVILGNTIVLISSIAAYV